ncbi:hypothetical protein TNCT_274991 [Trichonephila clavata]|uniref:Uncharacterized protein n=1 Tax=Trichonephila clavata TaxID=2740835 RepID=A0A8X6LXU4_TRICU|nr:hypothetical protein TNCT_274991 [Trichonephila clavata]
MLFRSVDASLSYINASLQELDESHIYRTIFDTLSTTEPFLNFPEEFVFCCAVATYLKCGYVTYEMESRAEMKLSSYLPYQ